MARATPAAVAPPRPVVLVGIPGLRWTDVSATATPVLWRLAEEGSVGSLVVHTISSRTCPADGWLTRTWAPAPPCRIVGPGRARSPGSLPGLRRPQLAGRPPRVRRPWPACRPCPSWSAITGSSTTARTGTAQVRGGGWPVRHRDRARRRPRPGRPGRIRARLPARGGGGGQPLGAGPLPADRRGPQRGPGAAGPGAAAVRAAAVRADDQALGRIIAEPAGRGHHDGLRAGRRRGPAPAGDRRRRTGVCAGLLDTASTRRARLSQLTDLDPDRAALAPPARPTQGRLARRFTGPTRPPARRDPHLDQPGHQRRRSTAPRVGVVRRLASRRKLAVFGLIVVLFQPAGGAPKAAASRRPEGLAGIVRLQLHQHVRGQPDTVVAAAACGCPAVLARPPPGPS